MPAYAFGEVIPVVSPDAYVHPDAVLIGDVVIGAGCYVGPAASLRGDFGRIELEPGSNVQDGCVLHCFPGRSTVVEVDGHVGHGAVLHGCRVGHGALIGINAVIMDGATIGALAFVAAHSFVASDFQVPPRSLVAGTPARVKRELTKDELTWKSNGTRVYQDLGRRSASAIRRVDPLVALEHDRPALPTPAIDVVPLRAHRTRAGTPSRPPSPLAED